MSWDFFSDDVSLSNNRGVRAGWVRGCVGAWVRGCVGAVCARVCACGPGRYFKVCIHSIHTFANILSLLLRCFGTSWQCKYYLAIDWKYGGTVCTETECYVAMGLVTLLFGTSLFLEVQRDNAYVKIHGHRTCC